jgi:GH18 family chitinase
VLISNRLPLIIACFTSLLFLNCADQNKIQEKWIQTVTPQRSVVYIDNWSIYHPGSWSISSPATCTAGSSGVLDTAAVITTMQSQLDNQVKAKKITHLNYGFARFNTPPVTGSNASHDAARSEYEIYFTDAWADTGPGAWSTNNCKFPSGQNFAANVGNGADGYGGLYCAMKQLKQTNPNLKLMVSVGGWGYPDSERINILKHFKNIAEDAYNIQNGTLSFRSSIRFKPFVTSIQKWMTTFGFDGVDIDWEFPFLSDADGSTDLTAAELSTAMLHFQALFQELRMQLGEKAIISMAFSPRPDIVKQFSTLKTLLSDDSLNFINLMAYDYYGAFDKTTGINAPYLDVPGGKINWSFQDSIDAFAAAVGTENVSKLNAGLAAYGRSYSNVDKTCTNANGLGCSFSSAGPDFFGLSSSATVGNGSIKYWQIQKLSDALANGTSSCQLMSVSSEDKTPIMLCPNVNQSVAISGVCVLDVIVPANINLGTILIGYDNPDSIKQKADYARSKGLGGTMMWTITGDDAGFSLLNAATNLK